jgi:ABC-type sugar transport system substrate-binding protein
MAKRILALLLVMVLSLSMVISANAESAKKKILIGFAINESDESMNTQQIGFKKYVEAFNASNKEYQVEYFITNAENDVQKQIDDVNSLIELGCQAICLHSVDTKGLTVAVDACNAAGVYLMEARGMRYPGINLRFDANDEYAIADSAFKWFEKNVMNDPSIVLKIGAVYGLATQTQQLIRVDQLIKLLKDAYGEERVIVVDSAYCDWDTQKSMEIMENWLQKYSLDEMNCLMNASGAGMVGAAQAILGFGGKELLDKYITQTTDANSDVLYHVYKGNIDITVGLNPVSGGSITAEVLIQAVSGVQGPHTFDISSGELLLGADAGGIVNIDATNVAAWFDPVTNTVIYPK